MVWHHRETWLFHSSFVSIGILEVPADHEAWGHRCVTSGPAQIAFPTRAIRTTVEGRPTHVGDRVITPLEVMLAEGEWVYRRRTIDPRGERSGVFQFDLEALRSAVALYNPKGGSGEAGVFSVGVAPVGAGAFGAQRRLMRLLLSGQSVDPLAVDERAAAILDRIASQVSSPPDGRVRSVGKAFEATIAAHAGAVRDALDYLEAHAHTRVTLAEVGAAVHTSPAHFARVFKAHTGSTIAGALSQIRLRRALEQVLDSRDPLWSIASRTGFADLAHFSNAFKKAFGMSPSAMRRSA